jgi:hypothetical protein
MKTLLTITATLALGYALSAQILRPGDSATLFSDPSSTVPGFGSVAWVRDPVKDSVWVQVSGATRFAYVVRDTTGLVVEPIDDYVVPFGGGFMWQNGSDLPEQVWLRVVLSDAALAPGQPIGAWSVRSMPFGFDRPGAGPFEVPEPVNLVLLVGVALAGFAAYRNLR